MGYFRKVSPVAFSLLKKALSPLSLGAKKFCGHSVTLTNDLSINLKPIEKTQSTSKTRMLDGKSFQSMNGYSASKGFLKSF